LANDCRVDDLKLEFLYNLLEENHFEVNCNLPGAIFSPPAVMISSLILPVTLKYPSSLSIP